MKIIVDLSDIGLYGTNVFQNKEEYDAHMLSQAGYERRRAEPWPRTGGLIERFSSEPHSFPCVQIVGGLVDRRHGPDEYDVTYIYDYKVVEE